MRAGVPEPLTTRDLTAAAKRVRPTTKEWFSAARNYALYANEGGAYDDGVAVSEDTLMDRLDRAWLLIEQNRFELAVKEADEALRAAPDDWRCHFVLSDALRLLERWDEADEAARAVIKLAPDVCHGHLALARVQAARGKTKDALKTLAAASELAADDPDYWCLLSHVQARSGKTSNALDAAEQGLALDPGHDECRLNHTVALINLGRVDEADRALVASLRNDPESEVNHLLRGDALLWSDRPREALGHFQEALRLDPTNEGARKGVVGASRKHNRAYAFMDGVARVVRYPRARVRMYLVLCVVSAFFLFRVYRKTDGFADGGSQRAMVTILMFVALVDVGGWLAQPLFTLSLLLRSRIRRYLSADEIRGALVAGAWLMYAVGCVVAAIYQHNAMHLWGVFISLFIGVPCVAVFECQPGWPRYVLACYSLLLAGITLYGQYHMVDDAMLREVVKYSCLLGAPIAGWLGALLSKNE